MGISHKHSYRFVYLRSDKWKDVRFEALVRDVCRCRICGEEDFGHDAHHVYYPESIWKTQCDDVVILCRPCHEVVQEFFFQPNDRKEGLKNFDHISTVLREWVEKKRLWLEGQARKTKKIKKKSTKCNVCECESQHRTLINIFKEMGGPDGYDFQKCLCIECLADLKTNVVVSSDDPNPLKRKGVAFRAMRIWCEQRMAWGKERRLSL